MISSRHRFHGHASLRNLYSRSQTVRLSPLMLLRYQTTSRRTGYRAAVIVSRKVHKSAVVRNRIRRRIYATLTNCQVQFNAPYDLAFLVLNESVADIPYRELEDLIRRQLERAGVIQPTSEGPSHVIVK